MFDTNYISRQLQKSQEERQKVFDDMAEDSEKAFNAVLEVPQQLKAMNEKLEAESRSSKKRDIITVTIAALTLLATITIGVITIRNQQPQQTKHTEQISEKSQLTDVSRAPD